MTLRSAGLGLFVFAVFASPAFSLTVENISIKQMTQESLVIVKGRVLSGHSQWEGRNIFTYTTVRVDESLKGEAGSQIIVKQLGGRVNEMAQEISGSPRLGDGEEVILFLTQWQANYWIHSIVLGKFSVVQEEGNEVAFNDLNNIGLIDPRTKREITEPNRKTNHFPLQQFMSDIRSYIDK